MAVAFPAALAGQLERSSPFENDNNVKTDMLDDGEPRQRVLGTDVYDDIRCHFKSLPAADYATLRTFLITNRTEEVTWTIDGVNYSGRLKGRIRKHMVGPLFNVSFTYYAKEV